MPSQKDDGPDTVIDHNANPIPPVRDAHDAGHHGVLLHDPSDEDARLDIALDESFPTSDAPGHSRPGTSDPAPSSGYDPKVEGGILRRRKRKAVALSATKIGVPLIVASGLIGYVGLRLLTVSGDETDPESFGVGA